MVSEVQMEDNHVYLKRTDSGERYIDADGYIIPVTMKETMLTIKIRKPTEHELCTCTFVNLTNDMSWYPETKTDNDITPDKYDNIIEEAENNQHANIRQWRSKCKTIVFWKIWS